MKRIIQSLTVLSMTFVLMITITSCEKSISGEPRIRYVRVTNPESSDSLLVGASQGRLIAIVGDNLKEVQEIWFNDQRASLTPTYITATTILVNVPSPIPLTITNKIKLIFPGGKTLMHDFEVQISKPLLSSMVSEYVNAGDVATIRGNFFYKPLTVKFTGGGTGEVVSVTDALLQVRVPANAQPGPITVSTNFGVSESDFWFRDNRNVFISSDPYEGWWNSSYVVTAPGPNDPPKISGNYIRVNKKLAAWSWNEVAGGPATAMPVHSKNIPDAAILKPSDYNLKFEVNTKKPYNNNVLKINVGLSSENNDEYKWLPPYDTKGQWQTVVIPFEDVVASYKKPLVVNPNGYWTRLLFHGPGELDADISLDNFRVVPKVNKK